MFVDDVTIFLATLQTCYTLHQPLNQVLEYTSSLLITLVSKGLNKQLMLIVHSYCWLIIPSPGFFITPSNNWMLEVGRDYTITVNVFDKMNHKIIITEVSPTQTLDTYDIN